MNILENKLNRVVSSVLKRTLNESDEDRQRILSNMMEEAEQALDLFDEWIVPLAYNIDDNLLDKCHNIYDELEDLKSMIEERMS